MPEFPRHGGDFLTIFTERFNRGMETFKVSSLFDLLRMLPHYYYITTTPLLLKTNEGRDRAAATTAAPQPKGHSFKAGCGSCVSSMHKQQFHKIIFRYKTIFFNVNCVKNIPQTRDAAKITKNRENAPPLSQYSPITDAE